ncbi:TetR family transcriptional regulator [Corynebacterium sp. MSK008]|uniref:TetR/AcrR family transcriptional regulator n=1 Tax=Corynebacterium sp. MSK008 TaxID=3050188 RepID=UPI00254F34FB|nr:TetR family transcriptional regulator [Corynebacterium sp. MSK008]MDK8879972.1 TetR family transcriptional regulator [Corynebacterium sp. MSK008]
MASRSEQARAVEKRSAILDAAIELLLTEGLKGLTHRQVAAAAAVPVGSIGYYYSTRNKLVATCFGKLVQGRLDAFKRAKDGGVELSDPVQLAEAVVDVVACGQPERASAVVTAFVEAHRESDEVGDYVRRALEQVKGLIAELLQLAGVDFNASRVLQIVVGTALTESHENAPVAAVADLLRLAEK